MGGFHFRRNKSSLRWVTAILAMVLYSTLAFAQPEPPPERPTIGLALGGGGARGAAHIGVLQVLDELNIPIDYVSGTSMGSVVGALFCLGHSPRSIETQICAIDWNDLFSDRPDRAQRTFRRKQDDSSFFLPLEFGFKDRRIVFSSGIIAGQKLGFAFPNPNLYLAGHQGFDQLAYPFRPVATDLATGEMFVMDRGNLLKAVRASMSIPGLFPPVEWEGHHLVDGFLSRNLPVDVVRNMGADIVIAVDVGNLPENTNPDKFQTLIGVAEQTGIIQARQNVLLQIPDADLVIQIDLEGISSTDYQKIAQTIPMGRKAAWQVAQQLRPFALSDADYQRHLDQHSMIKVDHLTIDTIELVNRSPVNDSAILRHIHQQPGHPLDLDQLKFDLGQIFDFGVFELVDFEITQDETQRTNLSIITNDKYYAPNVLNFGVTYSGGSQGRSYLDARIRTTRMEINGWGSELRTDLQLGRTNGIRSEFYQPLAWTRRPFIAASLRWHNQYQDWYLNGYHLGELKKEDVTSNLDLGFRLGRVGEIRLGVEYGHMRASDRTGLGLYDFSGPRGGVQATLNLDMLDSGIFPTRGYRLFSRVFVADENFGSNLSYTKAEGIGALYRTWEGQTFTLELKGGSSLDQDLPEFDKFTLGGPFFLEGYRPEQFRGNHFGLVALSWYTQIKGSPSPYSLSWYLGSKLEAGNVWSERQHFSTGDLRYSASLSLMVKTLLGPIAATYARAEDGSDSLSLTLGRLLPFFN